MQDLRMKTIHENERDYIISVLKKCGGRIWGPGGAAEVLNVPPSTLKSKMKKLGIQKEN
jgi:transcriptional regulator with GAF, ATPase, and Fis domain